MKQNNQITRHAEQCSSSEAVAHNKSSASWHKLRKTLNQVQGDDNAHPAIPTIEEGSRDIYPFPHQTPRLRSRLQSASFGFTLVELAIALMVIGLLIGGVLKGQELIENARVTRTIKDLKDYDAAVMIFRTTYDALPGDMKKPSRLPNCSAMPCNNTISVGTGYINNHAKSANFWRHLERAGLISGIYESVMDPDNFSQISPKNAFNEPMVIYTTHTGNPHITNDQLRNRFFIFDNKGSGFIANRMNVVRAAAIDQKIDDGKPLSGTAQIQHPGVAAWPGNICYDETSFDYLQNNHSLSCSFSVITDSLNKTPLIF